MDQPTTEIHTDDGWGLKSNIILDSTKNKVIYATHNSLVVYNLFLNNKTKIKFELGTEDK